MTKKPPMTARDVEYIGTPRNLSEGHLHPGMVLSAFGWKHPSEMGARWQHEHGITANEIIRNVHHFLGRRFFMAPTPTIERP